MATLIATLTAATATVAVCQRFVRVEVATEAIAHMVGPDARSREPDALVSVAVLLFPYRAALVVDPSALAIRRSALFEAPGAAFATPAAAFCRGVSLFSTPAAQLPTPAAQF